jgi:hypothetical protein
MNFNCRIFEKITNRQYVNDSLVIEQVWFNEIRIRGDSILILSHEDDKFNTKKPTFVSMEINENPATIINGSFSVFIVDKSFQLLKTPVLTAINEKKSIFGYTCEKFIGHLLKEKDMKLEIWKIPDFKSPNDNSKASLLIDNNGLSIYMVTTTTMKSEGFNSKMEGITEVLNFKIGDITDKDYDLSFINYPK